MNGRISGFTLIESMVATLIFLLFLGLIFGIYSATNQSMKRVEQQQEVYQTGRALLAQINAELTCAYQSANQSASALVGQYAVDAGTGLPQDTLTFITAAHPAPVGQPASDLCQVTYEISGNDTPDSPVGLYVAEDYYPGLEVANATFTPRLLSPLVIGLNCLFLDTTGTWQSDWENQTTFPQAIRVELTMKPQTPKAVPLVLVTTANLLTATAASATTASGTTATGSTTTAARKE